MKTPEAFPAPRPRRVTETHYLAVAVIRYGAKVALSRGLDDGLLADLWNFPSSFGGTRQKALQSLREKLASLTGEEIVVGRSVAEVRHTITHRSIRVDVYQAKVRRYPVRNSVRWFPFAQLHRAAVSQLARKICTALSAKLQFARRASEPVTHSKSG